MPLPHPGRRAAAGVATATTVGLALAMAAAPPAQAVDTSSAVIINEVFGGGGNTGAPFNRDFVELVNTGSSAVDLSAWSVQYASTSGTTWQRTALTGAIAPGGYYLIGEGTGTSGGAALPTVDVSGSIAMSATGGKVALTNTSAAPTGSTGANVVDFVGFGAANDAAGGSASTTPAPSNTTSAQRTDSPSVVNTGNNKADFFVAAPTPKAVNTGGSTTGPGGGGTTPGPDTIQDVQGSGFLSTKAGSAVSNVPGIVTARSSNGFWFQQPTRDAAKASSSSGLFVFTSSTPTVSVGDSVLVSGTVTEYYPGGQSSGALSVTEISSPTTTVLASGQALPAPLVLDASDVPGTYAATPASGSDINTITTVDPARSVQEFYEAHEGEVAAVDDVRTVGATDQYNELFVTVKPDEQATPRGGTYLPSYAAQPTGRIKIEPVSTTLPAYDVGDVIAGTTAGPIDWDQFGGYLIAATKVGSRTDNDLQPTVADRQADDQLAIATYNVENLSPKDPQSKLDRLGAGIVDNLSSPDVVTLEEIQDDDGPTNSSTVDATQTLQQLADAVVAAGGPRYSFTEIDPVDDQDGGQPGGNIRVAFFYNPDRVSFTPRAASGDPSTTAVSVSTAADGTAMLSSNPGRVDPTNTAWNSSRKPLAAEFVFQGKKVIVVANHFNSKGGDQSADGRIQPPVRSSETQRTAQARVLNGFVDSVQAADAGANVVLAGDFNDYQFSGPITTLTDNGATLTDLINTLPANERYTYVYNGVSQVLDHIFVTNNLGGPSTTAYQVVHLNAEFADQASDHDPQVVRIRPVAKNPNTTIQLLNINDFHGRIDSNTVKFAGTVEQQRALVGDANSVFLSAGDNIGASLFASASQDDNPTIDVLNALQLQASAVGNHEFDKGFSDLTDHVIPRANWDYLGANVYEKGTQTPALPEYAIVTVGGLKVGVIGAVTQQTPSLVSPGGISNLDFGDPVAAVNRVAAQLTDGDAANGEADVLVAEYHEGAPDSESDTNTLEQEEANSPVFASIVNGTSAKVAAIFTGHTHKVYTFDAPIPGDTTGATRPVLQTGEYGNNIGNITLTVNRTTKQVAAYAQSIVPRTTTPDTTLTATYPRVAEVKRIVDAALAQAAVEGQKPVGRITADITTAFANGGRDDRGSESTLGNLVADALRSELSPSNYGGADIGVVNPGGLRADLLYADTTDGNGNSTGGGDGVVTYAEANAVLPFVNNLYTLTLTGDQFRQVLEQQYQPAGASRPFLNLGLSNNVSYTYDPSKAAGSRIGTIRVNGQVLGAANTVRVATFSFLAQGGDNFTAFKNGTNVQDTGLIDRDAWIDYLGQRSPVSPNFTKRGVVVNNQPSSGAAGAALPTFTVSKLNLTSLGSPANTSLAAQMDGVDLGTFPVSNGSATVSVTLPSTATDDETLVLTASPTGTTVRIPISVVSAGTLTITNGNRFVAGDTVVSALRGWAPGETVRLLLDGTEANTVIVNNNGGARGVQTVLPTTIATGQHTLQAVSAARGSASAAVTFTVIDKPFQAGTLAANKTTVPAGGKVGLALRRWAPNVQADLTLDGSTALRTVTVDARGATNTVVVIPRSTTAGTHQIVATAPDGSLVSINIEVTAR